MKQNFIDALTSEFTIQADQTLKPHQEAYMRNQFSFFGINQTKRLAIQKELFKKYPIQTMHELETIVTTLWQLQMREYRYTALDLMRRYKKLWTRDTIHLLKKCILDGSWWDTVDTLAAHCLGPLCIQHPMLVDTMDNWIQSEQLWLRRSALLFQLRYKSDTNAEKLFAYCLHTMHEKEFFIRKAIGWALREYAKTNPDAVRRFVTKYESSLSPLSKREALRRMALTHV